MGSEGAAIKRCHNSFPSIVFSSRESTGKLECSGDEAQDLMARLPPAAPCEGSSLPKHGWEPVLTSGKPRWGQAGWWALWWEIRSFVSGEGSQRSLLCAWSIADDFQFLDLWWLCQVNTDAGQAPSISRLSPQYRILWDGSHRSSLKIAVSHG